MKLSEQLEQILVLHRSLCEAEDLRERVTAGELFVDAYAAKQLSRALSVTEEQATAAILKAEKQLILARIRFLRERLKEQISAEITNLY